MYVEETERLQTEGVGGWVGEGLGLGRRGELKDDGLINAIVFSCGSVATYLTGVDVRRWRAGPPTSVRPLPPPKKRGGRKAEGKPAPLFFLSSFLLLPIGQLDRWHKLDGESVGPSGGSNLSLPLFISRGSNDGVAILRVVRRKGREWGGRRGTRPIATSIS